MTHMTRRGFRRVGLAVLAAAALTAGGTAAASAATTGGSPQPSSYGQHHPKQVRHCEFDWLSGITLDQDSQGQDLGYGQASQSPYGQTQGHKPKAEKVEAFQLVKVCETGEHLTVTDVGKPYVEETEQQQEPPYVAPSPDASPSPTAYTTPVS